MYYRNGPPAIVVYDITNEVRLIIIIIPSPHVDTLLLLLLLLL